MQYCNSVLSSHFIQLEIQQYKFIISIQKIQYGVLFFFLPNEYGLLYSDKKLQLRIVIKIPVYLFCVTIYLGKIIVMVNPDQLAKPCNLHGKIIYPNYSDRHTV